MDHLDEVFAAVPRADFLPAAERRRADYDGPIPIGHGQTGSQPRTVADMLRLLEVRAGHRVLDVGAGSGWTTALLGRLVGPRGVVVGVEVIPELAAWGEANVRRTPYSWASVRLADPDEVGLAEAGPYDRILVSADAREVPEGLLAQLGEGGRMVLPVRGRMTLVVRTGDDLATTRHGYYRFVPLV